MDYIKITGLVMDSFRNQFLKVILSIHKFEEQKSNG